ncbi:MAG: DUF2442 domain-containing protein [Muribaculaceae bacterium]|nr:DUF2442 domain-containing protein [Muribaculaceae bacterium]MDE6794805.1 DUF2442 domain-containing protein [Muribaculaceae bacterium]
MCKDNKINIGIKKLNFTKVKGKMIVYLTDGRELVVPVSFFPDIKKLPIEKREEWMILDDQFFTFSHLSTVYSLSDLMRV